MGDWSDRLLNLVFIWCSRVTLLADGIVVVTKEAIELGFHSRLPMTEVETTRCTRPRKIRGGGVIPSGSHPHVCEQIPAGRELQVEYE